MVCGEQGETTERGTNSTFSPLFFHNSRSRHTHERWCTHAPHLFAPPSHAACRCIAEGFGGASFEWPLTPAQHATLTLIGAADMRVPPSQGREWLAALESRQPRPKVPGAAEPATLHDALEYEGEGHAIAGAEANAHAVQSAVAWLLAKLEVPMQ